MTVQEAIDRLLQMPKDSRFFMVTPEGKRHSIDHIWFEGGYYVPFQATTGTVIRFVIRHPD